MHARILSNGCVAVQFNRHDLRAMSQDYGEHIDSRHPLTVWLGADGALLPEAAERCERAPISLVLAAMECTPTVRHR